MAIINNHAGYGIPSGKVDEYGLPVYEPKTGKRSYLDSDNHESLDMATVRPRAWTFPPGGAAMFAVTQGTSVNDPLPTANFYDLNVAPIAVGWKRGLYVIAPALGIEGISIMVRKPQPGWKLKYSIESLSGTELYSTEIDANANCGINQVFKFPEQIANEPAVLYVEVTEVPADGEPRLANCCPLIVEARTLINDYCYEDWAGMPIHCCDDENCDGCDCEKVYKDFTPVA